MVTKSEIKKTFNSVKSKHPDTVILFRCLDFYESFYEDAQQVGEIIGIEISETILGNINHVPVISFPKSNLDVNLSKLIRAGLRVAICDKSLI